MKPKPEAPFRLLDLWEPPEIAGRPLACLATTFTLDADFFESCCLARFLAAQTGSNESAIDRLASLIEQQELLSQASIAVVVDRSERPGERSLLWDVLPVGVRGGLLHAKTTMLVWEHVVRFVVGSANLTPAGYRSQVEAVAVLDAFDGSQIPRTVLDALLDALTELVDLTPGSTTEAGPKQRASQTLLAARATVRNFKLPVSHAGLPVRMAIAPSGAGRRALDGLQAVWKGTAAWGASVLSPFFDTAPSANPARDALLADTPLARRGELQLRFSLPVDPFTVEQTVRAPRSLLEGLPARVDARAEAFPGVGDDTRRLHAKAIVLESDEWVAALIGSSNFTAAGLGLASSGSHREINLAIGAPRSSTEGRALLRLVPDGDELDIEAGEWCPLEDDDRPAGPVLPWGFVDALLDPPHAVVLSFDPAELPGAWAVRAPGGEPLLDSETWTSRGRPRRWSGLLAEQTARWLDVQWNDDDGAFVRASWALNVIDPELLPTPPELTGLSSRVLLRAYATRRALHEAIPRLLANPARVEQEPLKKHGSQGLFHRARELSAALAGLRPHLERRAASPQALRHRLRGPFSPLAIARALASEAESGTLFEGELEFSLTEISLALTTIDWTRVAGPAVSQERVDEFVREVLAELKAQAAACPRSAVSAYARRAMKRADST